MDCELKQWLGVHVKCVRALLEAGANHALDYAEWRWDSCFSQCMSGTAALLSVSLQSGIGCACIV